MRLITSCVLFSLFFAMPRFTPAAIPLGGSPNDDVISIIYDPSNGNLGIETGAVEKQVFVHLEIRSASGIFTGPDPFPGCRFTFTPSCNERLLLVTEPAGSTDADFGPFATPGLTASFVASDLGATVIGRNAVLGPIDLYYVPEPATVGTLLMCIVPMLRPSVINGRQRGGIPAISP